MGTSGNVSAEACGADVVSERRGNNGLRRFAADLANLSDINRMVDAPSPRFRHVRHT